MREIIPFSSFSTPSPPYLVLARDPKVSILRTIFPLCKKNKSLKKKESRSTTDYLKASNTKVMVLHRNYVLICICVFQLREGEFDIIT